LSAYLAVIPARKGSKGIPNKNRQVIGGKPMVQFTIEAAAAARSLDRRVVSSDDEEILRLARAAGIDAIERPARLATDDASTADVIAHVLDGEQKHKGALPSHVVLLQPTSPFRTASDIDAAIAAFEKSGRESLVSACPVSQHPAECVTVEKDGSLKLVSVPRVSSAAGRQSYAPCFFIDGAIYVATVEFFRRTGSLFGPMSHLFVLPRSHSLDIDEPFELGVARALHRYAETEDPNLFSR
jgi:CMP-N-acetylneuraminic acid synthetase